MNNNLDYDLVENATCDMLHQLKTLREKIARNLEAIAGQGKLDKLGIFKLKKGYRIRYRRNEHRMAKWGEVHFVCWQFQAVELTCGASVPFEEIEHCMLRKPSYKVPDCKPNQSTARTKNPARSVPPSPNNNQPAEQTRVAS